MPNLIVGQADVELSTVIELGEESLNHLLDGDEILIFASNLSDTQRIEAKIHLSYIENMTKVYLQ